MGLLSTNPGQCLCFPGATNSIRKPQLSLGSGFPSSLSTLLAQNQDKMVPKKDLKFASEMFSKRVEVKEHV